jgi:hypothetical protein
VLVLGLLFGSLVDRSYGQDAVPACLCMYPENELLICGDCDNEVCEQVVSSQHRTCIVWQLQQLYCCPGGKHPYKSYVNSARQCQVADKRDGPLPKENILNARSSAPLGKAHVQLTQHTSKR